MVDEVMTMKRLREGLEGVYDLDSVDDCQQVIRMLVRDLNIARLKEKEAEGKTKELALSVLSDNRKRAEELAKSVVKPGQKKRVNVLGFLLAMSQEMEGAEKLTNGKLADEILDKIWGSFDMSSKESALLGEAARRLKNGRKVAT